jgi:hypothetical protein
VRGQQLDRDQAAQAEIAGQMHHPHATPAQRADDLVLANPAA